MIVDAKKYLRFPPLPDIKNLNSLLPQLIKAASLNRPTKLKEGKNLS